MQEIASKATTEEEIPPCLRSRPVLSLKQSEYWHMFQELNGSRNFTSAGIAEIPYSEKIIWLNENEIFDSDTRKEYIRVISELDSFFVSKMYEKAKK